ncbi:MAG: hypothetical protein ACYC7L_07390 [Nitrospirota bacterium]
MLQTFRRCTLSLLRLFLPVLACLVASSADCFGAAAAPEAPSAAEEPAAKEERIKIEFEPDAYYTSLGVYLALTDTAIPHVGEQSEKDLYLTLLSRAYAPRFLIIEGSVNPLPYAGAYIREHHENFYADAQLTGSFNWIQAVTAGFEEPYAVSVFLGNVVDFSLPQDKKSKGIGYSGLLYSRGTYHIRNNTLIRDDWWEMEWKVKGDRKTQAQKLSWSFRFGTKLHENPGITDIYYLSFRRSRLDFRPKRDTIFNNSGFEYTVDMERGTFTPIRHYFFVEKKWPLENRKMAFSLATGFIWESAGKYSGTLAADHTGSRTQIILRPNLEF